MLVLKGLPFLRRFSSPSGGPFILAKKLREETGLPLADCYMSLKTHNNDYELAIKSLLAVTRKPQTSFPNPATETRVGVYSTPAGGTCLLKLRCRTDFAANSVDFGNFAQELVLHVTDDHAPGVTNSNLNDIFQHKLEYFSRLIREPVSIDRFEIIKRCSPNSSFGYYLHKKGTNGLGLRASVVEIEPINIQAAAYQSTNDLEKLAAHLTATPPTDLQVLLDQPYFFGNGMETVRDRLVSLNMSLLNFHIA